VVCRTRRACWASALNFEKRYISMGPVATCWALAFSKLEDPEHLLGERTHLGITLALVPAHSGGCEDRHPIMTSCTWLHERPVVRQVMCFIPHGDMVIRSGDGRKGWRIAGGSVTDGRATLAAGLEAPAPPKLAASHQPYARSAPPVQAASASLRASVIPGQARGQHL